MGLLTFLDIRDARLLSMRCDGSIIGRGILRRAVTIQPVLAYVYIKLSMDG